MSPKDDMLPQAGNKKALKPTTVDKGVTSTEKKTDLFDPMFEDSFAESPINKEVGALRLADESMRGLLDESTIRSKIKRFRDTWLWERRDRRVPKWQRKIEKEKKQQKNSQQRQQRKHRCYIFDKNRRIYDSDTSEASSYDLTITLSSETPSADWSPQPSIFTISDDDISFGEYDLSSLCSSDEKSGYDRSIFSMPPSSDELSYDLDVMGAADRFVELTETMPSIGPFPVVSLNWAPYFDQPDEVAPGKTSMASVYTPVKKKNSATLTYIIVALTALVLAVLWVYLPKN